ncbi:MAG: trehalose-phosphatase [Nitriliruptorales bacterium]|nr:trehalose-phosphatase [Nitriliruptorales bacterium]
MQDDLQTIAASIGHLRDHVVVVDFDGTISDLVEHPDDAEPVKGVVEALQEVARLTEVVVVSGRPLDDLRSRLPVEDVSWIGGHGAQILRRDGHAMALVDPEVTAPVLDRAEQALREIVDPADGWIIERKTASIALHHRIVPLPLVAEILPKARSALVDLTGEPPSWELLDGKSVVEMRPRGVNKGAALAMVDEVFDGRSLLVVGDDVTDEDAFSYAETHGGFGILVAMRPRETSATFRLDRPSRVASMLRRLTEQSRGQSEVMPGRDEFHPIGEYGIIGDNRTCALVSPDGSIDWMCAPRFDSPSVFGAILDPDRGGRFRIRPVEHLAVQRAYVGDTNVLVTRFVRDGEPVLTITDFLVYSRVNAFNPSMTGHTVGRRVDAHEDVEVEVEFSPRFDYGRATTELTISGDLTTARSGTMWMQLSNPGLPLELKIGTDGQASGIGRVTLGAGTSTWTTLRTTGADQGPHTHLTAPQLLNLTVRTWGRWARNIEYDGRWRRDVIRSALVLKALVYEPTGAMVAAATTSLPEGIGGSRNWDYRYAWIRDSAWSLECFLRIGHTSEAETFIRWLTELADRIGGAHALQPLYRVTGEEDLIEFELDHLRGYRDSRPVRVGNGAAGQLQLDIFGAAMELAWLTVNAGEQVPTARWDVTTELVETVSRRWAEPDAGLWEIRSEPRHHTFSKFQCWLAVDRAIRLAVELGLQAPFRRWERTRRQIRESILANGFDATRNTFVQAYGQPQLDASLLLLPLRGFLPADDPRVRGTVEAIRQELEVSDGLLLRYRSEDGLPGHEGAFLLCSFWLIEVLARMGDLDEAIRLFERLREFAGPLGLYAEELDTTTHEQLGNFPQAFTHMGLIMAATAIDQELRARDRLI